MLEVIAHVGENRVLLSPSLQLNKEQFMLKQRVKKFVQMTVLVKRAVIAFLVGASALFSSGTLSAQNPNVLFIGVDDLNNFTGFAGHPDAITPNMDRLASEGVHFPRAYCAYPLCGASRASLMTGVYFSELNTTLTQPADDEVQERIEALGSSLLHTYLGDRGYKTMAVGKIFHRHVPDGSVDLSGGRDNFDSNENAAGERIRLNWPLDLNHENATTLTDWGLYLGENGVGTEADMGDTISAGWAIDRLEETHTDPFMLMVGFLHPHVPWYVPQKYYDMYDPATLTLPPYLATDFDDIPLFGFDLQNSGFPTTEWAIASGEWREILHAYLANVSYVDAQIGRVLDALDNSPYADNTVVMLWGDHGYHLGEKNIFQKDTLWDRSGVTPLIIKAPGMAAGAECNRVVSLLDIYPTLLDLCNLPPNEMVRGRTLKPLLQDPTLEWDYPAFTFHRESQSVQYGQLHHIAYSDGSEELYDHANDPNEWTNLVDDPAYSEELANLRGMSPFADDPAPTSTVFTFLDDGPLDRGGIGANMTVDGVTITTLDVIGLEGTRASDGTNNITNIGNTGGLGINSAVSDTARNFESDEGWEFSFNTDVQLENILLLQTNAGGTLTISSESFPDIVLAGELDGDNDLGNTLVPANTLVSFLYTHTGPQGTDGPRIINLSVTEVDEGCVLGDVNQDGFVDFSDINPFVSLLLSGQTSCEADVDQNGVVNFDDIPPFVQILLGN